MKINFSICRTLSRLFVSILIVSMSAACQLAAGQDAAPSWDRAEGEQPPERIEETWVLTDPEAFDLGIDPAIFQKYLLSHSPHQVPKVQRRQLASLEKCHTQGMAIVRDAIVIGCCFYDAKNKHLRAYAGEAFLLRARLSDVLKKKEGELVNWKIRAVTSPVPRKDVARINHALRRVEGEAFARDVEDYRRELFPNTEAEDKPLSPLLNHPSGLIADRKGRVWGALAVYGGPGTYASIKAFHPGSLSADRSVSPISVADHIGWLALFQERFLVGETWGGLEMIIIDSQSGAYRKIANPYRADNGTWRDLERMGFGHCAQIDETYAVCGGNWAANLSANWFRKGLRERRGKLYLVKGEGPDLEHFAFTVVHPLGIRGDGKDALATGDLGRRLFKYKEGVGDVETHVNHYGRHESPLTLTNEGIALSPDLRSIYFLPEDIPGAKLIRYHVNGHLQKLIGESTR